MTVTAAEIKAQILLEVGDVDPSTGDPPTDATDGVVYQKLDWLWDRYAADDLVASGLRELKVKRAAILMVLAVIRPLAFDYADTLAGPSIKASQVRASYEALLKAIDTDIEEVKTLGTRASAGVFASDKITTKAPYTPDYGPDGNWWRRYGGSPYRRRYRSGGTGT